jgi:hypothetical protein
MGEAFVRRIKKQIANVEKYLKRPNMQEGSREELLKKKERLEGVLTGEIK